MYLCIPVISCEEMCLAEKVTMLTATKEPLQQVVQAKAVYLGLASVQPQYLDNLTTEFFYSEVNV